MKMTCLGAALALAAATAAPASPAAAQGGAAFFDGKTVTYIVATAPGGGYDTNGRLVAEYMQKYLPGSTFVVQNMPGAGHILAANYIYASEPDGLTIGTFNTGLIYNQLVGADGVQFDLDRMSWIGKLASEPRVIVVSDTSGIKSFQDLAALKEPVKFASAGVGSASYVEIMMLKDALDLPVQIITGYNGNEDQLALRRGEVQGIVASRSTFQRFVDEGHGRFIAQIGGPQTDVPQLSALVSGERAQSTVALIQSNSSISRLTVGPDGMPADRLAALREAYARAAADPEFLKRAAALDLPIDPMIGDDLRRAIEAALAQPKATVDLLQQALAQGK
jgi:tripartite-type tricarboxylate transporter receptor subunit TctC